MIYLKYYFRFKSQPHVTTTPDKPQQKWCSPVISDAFLWSDIQQEKEFSPLTTKRRNQRMERVKNGSELDERSNSCETSRDRFIFFNCLIRKSFGWNSCSVTLTALIKSLMQTQPIEGWHDSAEITWAEIYPSTADVNVNRWFSGEFMVFRDSFVAKLFLF